MNMEMIMKVSEIYAVCADCGVDVVSIRASRFFEDTFFVDVKPFNMSVGLLMHVKLDGNVYNDISNLVLSCFFRGLLENKYAPERKWLRGLDIEHELNLFSDARSRKNDQGVIDKYVDLMVKKMNDFLNELEEMP